jgi:hypothetical protein
MSVVSADLKLFLPTTLATSLTSPSNIGGAATSTQITGGSLGEVLFAMSAEALGGSDKIQYGKAFQGNTNGSTALTSAKMWLANALDQVAGNHVITASSTSPLDDSTRTLRAIGNNATPADAQDEFSMNGNSTVTGAITMSQIHAIELRATSGGALVAAVGTISIYKNGTLIGIIPPGAYSATAEIDMGLASTLDDTATTTNAGTAPSGITFTRPRTSSGGIAVANSGSLTAGAKQGFWLRWTLADGRRPSSDIEIYPLIIGETT